MKTRVLFFIFLIFSAFTQAQDNDYALAENYFRNNEYEKAASFYEKLVDKSPYNATYLKNLSACYQEMDNFAKANELLQAKLKQYPQLTFINVLLGYNYERNQQDAIALQHYQKAIESLNESPTYATTIAGLLREYSKLELAIKAYKKANEKNPNSNHDFRIAELYGEMGNYEQMFQSYIDFLDSDDKHLDLVKRFAAKYVSDDAEDERNLLFKKALLRKSASNPKAVWNDLLSWLFVKQKQYSKALIQQKALYIRDADNLAGIKQLGNIAFYNNDFVTAKACFDMVIDKTNYPTDKFHAIYMRLLSAVKTQETDLEQQFQAIFDTYGLNTNTFQIQLAYADYLTFEKNQPEKAIEVLDAAVGFANSKYLKAYAKLKLADVLVYQGLYNKALIYYSQVQNSLEDHVLAQEAQFKVAQTSYFKGDFKWAKAQLKVLKKSASKLIANDAADLFLTISDNEPKDSISTGLEKYAKADLLAFQNKNDEAIALLNEVVTEYKGQAIEDEALFKQATLYVKKKKYDEAVLNYAKIIGLDDQGIYVDDVYYHMAELYKNELNQPEKAKEYYQKIIFDHPSSIYLIDARNKFRKLRGDIIN